eukprot:3763443-Amphidinium_carterae.2
MEKSPKETHDLTKGKPRTSHTILIIIKQLTCCPSQHVDGLAEAIDPNTHINMTLLTQPLMRALVALGQSTMRFQPYDKTCCVMIPFTAHCFSSKCAV